MIRFRSEQTIARPAQDVWSYAADVIRHPEWMGVIDARLISGQPTEIGARAVERVTLGRRKVDVEIEVSDSIPGQRIAWRMAGGSPLRGDVALDIESLGPDRARAVWSGSIGLTGLWRLVEPLVAAEVKAGEAAELRRLKEALEVAPAIAPATA